MDFIVDFMIELVGILPDISFGRIKNPRKRKWALTGLYSFVAIFFAGCCLWATISFYQDKDDIAAAIFGGITVLIAAICGYVIIRGHRRSWKSKKIN